ncbi:transcriptional repressor [Mesobacterium sp. TK19101]|uniref:Transcriptional repressor n=1 Tax=Mesobacterium hydrothermale TaxID=3111907 RepID=A0ABU6HB69_9RHOB|nr:transcriptional repressor [Mesobacterium sp. TK19101]MEC3859717.1 transcriptional repressor [Mesobacterium sp. TK19101]
MDTIGFAKHDHAACIQTAIATARDQCSANGLQLTPARERVLEILLSEHRAMGAYEILEILRNEGLGSQPPVAYRALDFLVSHGFAHKVEKLNAFVACNHPGQDHAPAFLICRICGSVAETAAVPKDSLLGDTARAAGFVIEKVVIEAEGLCPNCRGKAAA